jgi:hypothetical protein
MYPKHKYKVEVFAICYNEEHIIQAFIDHYKNNFDAKLTFFDNQSTDKTPSIIQKNKCELISFDTNNEIDETNYLRIKNNCWKDSNADYVIVCDVDEFLEIHTDIQDCTLIKTFGFDIVGDLDSRMGVYNELYCKYIMFSPKHIKEINYTAGCHYCNPEGKIIENEIPASMLHRKYISEDYLIKRHQEYSNRNSNRNKESGNALHYDKNSQIEINYLFEELRKKAQII